MKMDLHRALLLAKTLEAYGTPINGIDEWTAFAKLCKELIRNEMERNEPPVANVAEEWEPTWQERMQQEYHELKERYEKLHRMVTKYEAGTLEFTQNCSLELLRQQKRHMGEYLHDLEIRAEIEKVEL